MLTFCSACGDAEFSASVRGAAISRGATKGSIDFIEVQYRPNHTTKGTSKVVSDEEKASGVSFESSSGQFGSLEEIPLESPNGVFVNEKQREKED
jgi:hypothetical protein